MRKLKIIVARDAATDKLLNIVYSYEEASRWVISTGKADCRGHVAAQRTVITNIKNCIKQPELYTQFYGIKWSMTEKQVEE